MENKQQNQLENGEVNELKNKHAEKNQKNEEFNEYNIMPLQNNMMTLAVGHKDQPLNKKFNQQRQIWSGKYDNLLSSNSILETIEENDNMHQPIVSLANFGDLNKGGKDPTVVTEFTNNENIECFLSPPSNICETPKKVLRERVNNYKRMFETSMKENNELREFTTLEKQMFYDNNEQLKDINNLRKQIDILQVEKNESEKTIEKLKYAVEVAESEKLDIKVIIEEQRNKFKKRENELLATIQETKKELKSKEDQNKKFILGGNFMTEKQEENKRLDMKIKEIYQLNNTYTNEIDTLKLQLLNKDQKFDVELSERCSLLKDLCLQSYVAEVKSIPRAIQFLADEEYFSLKKCEILGLVQLLENIHNIVEQLEQKNKNLINENNNLKLITNNFNTQLKNTKKENDGSRLKLNSIEEKIIFTIKKFSGSSEINIDNTDTDNLIEFARKHFEENTNKVDMLSNNNLILKEKLSISNIKLGEIISFVFNNLDFILQSIYTMEERSSTKMEKLKKELSETMEENIFLKSSIQLFDILTFECVDIIEKVKINQSNVTYLQEELTVCNGVKNVLQLQIEELKGLNTNLNMLIENQTKIEKQIKDDLSDTKFKLLLKIKELDERKIGSNKDNESEIYNELIIKTKELEIAVSQIYVLQLTIEEMKIKTNSNAVIIERLNNALDSVEFELKEKSKLVDEFKNNKSKATTHNNLETINGPNEIIIKLKSELKDKLINEKILKNELQIITAELDDAIVKVDEIKSIVDILKINDKSNSNIVQQLNYELKCIESILNEKNESIIKLEYINLELLTKCTNSDNLNKIISELEIKLKNKINIESKLQDELKAKTTELEYAMLQENEIQTVVESMENEIKSNVVLIDQFKFELDTKSELLTKSENANSELVLNCDKFNGIILNNTKDNEQYYLDIHNQLQLVSKEKLLIQNDLNLISQQCLEISKHYDESKKYFEDKVQLCVLNSPKLYIEFVNLSCDIESLLKCLTITISNLREEILLKSSEIEHLKNLVQGSGLQQKYDKLEKEYKLRSRECDEAQGKILDLESMLSRNEESENVLKNDYKAKCIALEEYKKSIEFLVSRNNSFQIRINDFENNVLVNLNEEFDLIKLELSKKTDHEEMLLEEKANLKCNLKELQEQLINVTKEMKLKEDKYEDLATINDVLVIEINYANSFKQNLESCLNEAEHELLKSGDLCENLKLELYSMQRELENACIKVECIEKQLQNLEFKFNDKFNKKYFDGCSDRNQLIDSLVDFVHDIKLKLTELNSAMISGNQSEKSFRTKIVSGNDYVLPHKDIWKISCNSQPESPNGEIGLEIDYLHKILKEKNNLINALHTTKNEMEKNICELQCLVKDQFDENIKHVNDIQFMKNDLKEKMLVINNLNKKLNDVQQLYKKLREQINEPREQNIKPSDNNEKLISHITLTESNLQDNLICNLKNELNNLKIEFIKLEEHNQANKKQIDYSYDIDLELRNGKRNIINEINLLEPGKIIGVYSDHNLSNLLDTFFNLIMTKEHQIVTQLASNHNKIKQLYEDKINQMQKDIKKGKEWQEQVENYNEKLGLELENLKLQKHNFPNRELKIKTLTEKVLEAENLSKNYLSELEELKIQLSKISEQNFQSLSHEFEVFKTDSEQSIQDLKNKLENLTEQYNETLSVCEVQKNNRFILEELIGKIQLECACLKSVIEKKDEDIKNLLVGFKLKTNEYEIIIKKHSLQKEEMGILHEKKINDLQLDLSNMKHKMYCTEKFLKEINKNNQNGQVKLNMNDNSLIDVNNVTQKLRTILKCDGTLPEIYEKIFSLMSKCEYFEEEIKELKHANINLDNECESMLDEVNIKSNKITELLTQVDMLNRNIELLTEEKEFLENKCKQFKIFNNDIKKLNDEICSYEQNIYELRKDKGQLIVQHNKELKQLKNELQEVQVKNLELFNEYSALSETAKNLEKSLKEEIQQLNRCIVDKNSKISTLEVFFKSYSDDLKKKNCELEIVFKRAREENHTLRSELRRLKKGTNVYRADHCTQTVEEQSLVSSATVLDQKYLVDKIAKFENDSKIMKMMLHHRKSKIEELEKQLDERHCSKQ